jgi:hypothetical protein
VSGLTFNDSQAQALYNKMVCMMQENSMSPNGVSRAEADDDISVAMSTDTDLS